MSQVCAFSLADMPINDLSSKKWIEVSSGTKLYDLLIQHIASYSETAQSYSAVVVNGPSQKGTCTGCDCNADNAWKVGAAKKVGRISLNVGLGVFSFLDLNGNRLHAIHQTRGDPVGTQCGVDQFKCLVVVTESSELTLSAFFSQLIEA